MPDTKFVQMDLQRARKQLTFHGVVGIAFLLLGTALISDGTYRRVTEPVVELWMAEIGLGFMAGLVGLLFFGSAVRFLVHMDRIAEYAERRERKYRKSNRRATLPKKETEIRPLHGKEPRLQPLNVEGI